VLSSNYGGWGFNGTYDIIDPVTIGSDEERYIHLPADQAANLTDEQLRTNPFFKLGDSQLYQSGGAGHNYAAVHQNKLVTEMIPCRTWPIGANPLGRLPAGRNFDMNSEFKDLANGWPRPEPEWRHSDMKNVAYPYVHILYDKLVEHGGLK
jgi:hypothetical protein